MISNQIDFDFLLSHYYGNKSSTKENQNQAGLKS